MLLKAVNTAEKKVKQLAKTISPYSILISKVFVLSFPMLSIFRSLINFNFDIFEKGTLLHLNSLQGNVECVLFKVTCSYVRRKAMFFIQKYLNSVVTDHKLILLRR